MLERMSVFFDRKIIQFRLKMRYFSKHIPPTDLSKKISCNVQGLSIKIDRDTIEPKDEARNLGVIFDKHMTLKAHVNAVCKSARYYLHNINVARRYLTTEAAEKAMAQTLYCMVYQPLN